MLYTGEYNGRRHGGGRIVECETLEAERLKKEGKCPICRGLGKTPDGRYDCTTCNGTGKYQESSK